MQSVLNKCLPEPEPCAPEPPGCSAAFDFWLADLQFSKYALEGHQKVRRTDGRVKFKIKVT